MTLKEIRKRLKKEMPKRIKHLRQSENLTRKQLKKALKISYMQLFLYEHGLKLLSVQHLFDYCKFFNVSADYLFGKTDKK